MVKFPVADNGGGVVRRAAAIWMWAACMAGLGGVAMLPAGSAQSPPTTAAAGSPGPLADSCGTPATPPQATGRGAQPTFPPGQFPVSLPPVSHLGAHNDLPNPYGPGVHWGRLPDGRTWGSTAGIARGIDDTIWAIDRCGASGAGGGGCADSPIDPILQFDTTGKLLKSFGRGVMASPHKISVDRAGDIWVADSGQAPGKGHQVHKFSPNGTLVMSLGKPGVAGSAPGEFNQPTDVAVAPNGDIYVADGHVGGGTAVGNARIVRFDRRGEHLGSFGKKGMGPGELDVPHALAFDSRGRLFVADRQNNRLQIFDATGKFIDSWFQFGRPSGFFIDRDDTLYVADSESRDGRTNLGVLTLAQTGYGFNPGARRGIRIGSARDGKVTAFIPDPCPYPYPGGSSMAEGVVTDREGNVYGADFLGTVRKYIKR